VSVEFGNREFRHNLHRVTRGNCPAVRGPRFNPVMTSIPQCFGHFNAEGKPPVAQPGNFQIGTMSIGSGSADGMAIDKNLHVH
jgi:hypothetical protein